jgi:hypothetical protein
MCMSATVGREHHLFSDLEELVFLYADFSPHIVDIREQFPLFSRAETEEIAEEMGIKHPQHAGSSDVLTEDFVFTTDDSTNRLQARQVKYVSDLAKEGIREKLEIQRRYFERRGIEWRIVTERDLSTVISRNLRWLRRGAFECFEDIVAKEFSRQVVLGRSSETLARAIERAGSAVDLDKGQASLLFRRLVWNHDVELNINKPLELSTPLSSLALQVSELG